MSVSLSEVLSDAGFDIKNNRDDAQWLLSQRDEFDELCETADETIDKFDEEDYDE